ncbi:MAG: hypothetical protein MI757_03110, partial [Pirellulales bacterium]|nr:hypothetical protein [Pirellulales bacterium]
MTRLALFAGLSIFAAHIAVAAEQRTNELIGTISKVDRFGKGHIEAVAAVEELAAEGPQALLPILGGMRGTNPLAANWLRGAFESIADRTLRAKEDAFPASEIERFVTNRDEDPRARRLAYEWLIAVDPKANERLISDMLMDRSPAFRRDAVSYFIGQAKAHAKEGRKVEAKKALEQALSGAV